MEFFHVDLNLRKYFLERLVELKGFSGLESGLAWTRGRDWVEMGIWRWTKNEEFLSFLLKNKKVELSPTQFTRFITLFKVKIFS